MTDVVIVAAGFMLRESELGSALFKDLGVTTTHVLRLRGAANPEDPFFPAQDGGFLSKHAVIHKLRQVLHAAGIELTYVDPNSRLRQLFGGLIPTANASATANHVHRGKFSASEHT